MSEDFYEVPRAEISQGDIFELLPHVHLKYPLRLLKKSGEDSFTVEEVKIDAGISDPTSVAACRLEKGMLLTHDCEVDKNSIKNWIVSPIVPLAELPGGAHGNVRKNKILHFVHLPPYRDLLKESVVVLNQSTTIEHTLVRSAQRIVSLSDLGRRALYGQHIRWLTRWQLSELQCPHCGVTFSGSDAMKVRS